MSDEQPDIRVQSLCKVFGDGDDAVEALRGVDLSVSRGETLCVVGPSGCGKTTLLRIMLGLEHATSGSVLIDQNRLDQGIAYVQQTPTLLPWRTVVQNAALGIELRKRLDTDRLEYIRDELRKYGLSGFENRLVGELSGGMKQRVELIRALESRPALLFCDEPFSAIDFVTRLSLSARFRHLCRVYGVTTVFVTHNIEEAIFLGSEVAVLSGRPGRVISTYRPALSLSAEDPVRCRESPEFTKLFSQIWADLEGAHAV